MKDIIMPVILILVVSLSVVFVYDRLIIVPSLEAAAVKVVDVEYLLGVDEKLVRAGKMSIEEYKIRAERLESILSGRAGVVLNRYVNIKGSIYPVVFGGNDITDDVQAELGVGR